MRILHVISSLDPSTGGPPMVVARLAAAQASALARQSIPGATRILSYQSRVAQANIAAALASIPGIQSVDLQFLPPLTRSEHYWPRNARQTLRKLAADADLLHLHGVWDPIVRTAAAVAAEASKPYVITPHGMLDPWALSQKRWKKSLALATGYRNALSRAAFIHYLNADEQSLAQPLHLKAPARVIPNGIFLEELTPLPPAGSFRSQFPQLADRPFLLFLGRLHYKKGLDYLADAFAQVCREIPMSGDISNCGTHVPALVVAGPDEGARESFESQIRQARIADRVHLVGPLYGPAKLAALRDCACFCLPSRQEGFSLAILEALACATPVVISQQCHFPEAAVAGKVVELNASAIAVGLLDLLRDPNAAIEMGKAGRMLVEARYTWPRVADEMLIAYGSAK